MDIAALFQMAMFQLVTARESPIPIVLASIVAGLVVWLLTKWRYTAMIQSLKRAIVRRDAELAKLRAHIPMAAEPSDDADGSDQTSERGPAPSNDRRKALRLVINAIDQAELALRTNEPRDVDRALASMGLALQAVNRQFGLPVPGVGASAPETLSLGKRYLEQVRPSLRAGQDDEARGAAVAFLSR